MYKHALYINPYTRAIDNIIVYSPANLCIHDTANLNVNNMRFNKSWREELQSTNTIPSSLYIGENTSVDIGDVDFYSGAHLSINEGAKFKYQSGYVNEYTLIDCYYDIQIGSDVMIGKKVLIRDHNNHYIKRSGYKEKGKIRIGNHVWVASGVIILCGVTIGSGSVVAAGSVVLSDVPDNTLVAGNPAKIKRENINWM